MRKCLLCSFVFLFLLPNTFAAKLKVIEDANIRLKPSVESEIIEIVNKDTLLEGNLSEENNNWFQISLENETNGFIHKSLIEEVIDSEEQEDSMILMKIFTYFSSKQFIIIGIILLLIWLIAVILSKSTKCVIVFNWYDLITLIIPGIIFLLYLFEIKFIVDNISLMIVICSISFIISILLSIRGNLKSKSKFCILYIFISLFTKIVLIILAPIAIIAIIGSLYVAIFGKGFFKKDGRYRDGTKGNLWTIFINFIFGIVFGLLSLLILPLIKTDEIITDNNALSSTGDL